MGYLSQKKQQIRENIFLSTMTFVLFCVTLLFMFFPVANSKFLNFFHIYCLSGIFFFYSLIVKRFVLSASFAFILAVNYVILAISGNIFLSNTFKGNSRCELTFASQHLLSDSFEKEKIISSGSLIIAKKYISPYVVLDEKVPIVFIRVDFRGAKRKEYPLIFKHLHDFIVKQDSPVVIFGEFGIPSWEVAFRNFLNKAELTIKNKMLFTEGSRFNIFTLPSFYVLGFREMGVNAIHIQEINGEKIIKTDISFNSAMR